APTGSQSPRQFRNRALPCLEPLEDRLTPANYYSVSTLLDTPCSNFGNGEDEQGFISLRSAIEAGNRSTDPDSIIDLSNMRGTITLGIRLPPLQHNFAIIGAGFD